MKTIISAFIVVCIVVTSFECIYAEEVDMLWYRNYDIGKFDFTSGVAIDSQDNVIVTGYIENSKSDYDFYTIKYGPSGNLIWSKAYDSGRDNKANGITIDSQDNVIITGYSRNSNEDSDFYTIKYDSKGNKLWDATNLNQGTNLFYGADDVAVDSQDNVLVVGTAGRNPYDNDYLTIKYDSKGKILWAKGYNYGWDDEATGVAIDSQDNVIVTGHVRKELNNKSIVNYLTIKYDSKGNKLWERYYDSDYWDEATGVAVDSEDNVIVTGYIWGSKDNFDFYTIKYDSKGNKLWDKREDRGEGDRTTGVAVDSENNVIIVGSSKDEKDDINYYIIKYDPNGNTIWSKSYDSGNTDYASGIAVDSQDNIIVTGTLWAGSDKDISSIDRDGLTIKLKISKDIKNNSNEDIKETTQPSQETKNTPGFELPAILGGSLLATYLINKRRK